MDKKSFCQKLAGKYIEIKGYKDEKLGALNEIELLEADDDVISEMRNEITRYKNDIYDFYSIFGEKAMHDIVEIAEIKEEQFRTYFLGQTIPIAFSCFDGPQFDIYKNKIYALEGIDRDYLNIFIAYFTDNEDLLKNAFANHMENLEKSGNDFIGRDNLIPIAVQFFRDNDSTNQKIKKFIEMIINSTNVNEEEKINGSARTILSQMYKEGRFDEQKIGNIQLIPQSHLCKSAFLLSFKEYPGIDQSKKKLKEYIQFLFFDYTEYKKSFLTKSHNFVSDRGQILTIFFKLYSIISEISLMAKSDPQLKKYLTELKDIIFQEGNEEMERMEYEKFLALSDNTKPEKSLSKEVFLRLDADSKDLSSIIDFLTFSRLKQLELGGDVFK